MAGQGRFDLARDAFADWPWMFGRMYWAIFEKTVAEGLSNAWGPVHLLVHWCTPYMTPEEINDLGDVKDLPMDESSLQILIGGCMVVAQRKGAWEYIGQQERKEVQEVAALGRALP